MSKSQKLVLSVLDVLEQFDTDTIKTKIGDSVNNNRTVTVSQFIRFLSTFNKRKWVDLAVNLDLVYNTYRSDIIDFRLSNRTDAVDINELIYFLDEHGLMSSVSRKLVA